jgi:hypothetical protein
MTPMSNVAGLALPDPFRSCRDGHRPSVAPRRTHIDESKSAAPPSTRAETISNPRTAACHTVLLRCRLRWSQHACGYHRRTKIPPSTNIEEPDKASLSSSISSLTSTRIKGSPEFVADMYRESYNRGLARCSSRSSRLRRRSEGSNMSRSDRKVRTSVQK